LVYVNYLKATCIVKRREYHSTHVFETMSRSC